MIGIDTNILVRYLTQDDENQSMIAIRAINKYEGKASSILVNNIVMCELIWVLERGYKYSKQQVIAVIKEIASTVEFTFENHQNLWLVINEYEKSKADFSDILIGKINMQEGCMHTLTFDTKTSDLSSFVILE